MRALVAFERQESYILHHAYINHFQNAPAGKTSAYLNHKGLECWTLEAFYGFQEMWLRRKLYESHLPVYTPGMDR